MDHSRFGELMVLVFVLVALSYPISQGYIVDGGMENKGECSISPLGWSVFCHSTICEAAQRRSLYGAGASRDVG